MNPRNNRNNMQIDDADTYKYLTVSIAPSKRVNAFPLIYTSNVNFPLIDNLGDFNVALDSASIPADNLPLWVPKIVPFPNTNNNLTPYSFSLEYNGTISDETFLIYIPQNPNKIFIPLSIYQPTPDYNSTYYEVYTVDFFIKMLNNTLTSAFNNLSGKIALPAGAVPPYFSYRNNTDKLSINAQQNYYDIDNTPIPIKVYANYDMFTLTDKIDFIYYGTGNSVTSPTDFQYYISNFRNNVIVPSDIIPPYTSDDYYLSMEQELPSISNLSPIKSICIVSSSLPIRSDYIPRKVGTSESLVGEEVILTEFEPILRFPQENVGNNILYRPQYRRWKNMKSQLALQRIDVTVYWRDFIGNLHIVYSNLTRISTIRLVFQKKKI